MRKRGGAEGAYDHSDAATALADLHDTVLQNAVSVREALRNIQHQPHRDENLVQVPLLPRALPSPLSRFNRMAASVARL